MDFFSTNDSIYKSLHNGRVPAYVWSFILISFSIGKTTLIDIIILFSNTFYVSVNPLAFNTNAWILTVTSDVCYRNNYTLN